MSVNRTLAKTEEHVRTESTHTLVVVLQDIQDVTVKQVIRYGYGKLKSDAYTSYQYVVISLQAKYFIL